MTMLRLSYIGPIRIYFNRHGDAPLVCCVAPECAALDGSWPRWELAVRGVVIDTHAHTVYRPKETPDDEDGKPSFWLECSGELVVDTDGVARIFDLPPNAFPVLT